MRKSLTEDKKEILAFKR